MQGLIIWAHSYCRSTIAFYQELGRQFAVPIEIYILHSDYSLRKKVGFKGNEFEHLNYHFIGTDEKSAFDTLVSHQHWNHLFASYQKTNLYSHLISEAIKRHIVYAIASEAPCNMMPCFPKRMLKFIYINWILPCKVREYVNNADFIINYSGYYKKELEKLGWKSKIISCGYYPPPIPNSICAKRNESSWNNFTILLSGIHQWHRSPLVLLKALKILQNKGIHFKCFITQDGPLLNQLKKYVSLNFINNVEFLGFVSLEKLVELYQTCSIYVGSGSYEPWGMRLNDVLQCGSPLIVSRGMGGAKLVNDYQCGLTFDRGNYQMLAEKLELVITNQEKYLKYAEYAYSAASKISPQNRASEIVNIIRKSYPNWM